MNIKILVAEYYKLDIKKAFSKSRKKEYVQVRQITMYLLRENSNISLPKIGRELGGIDHTTVLHAHKTIKNYLEWDKELRQDIMNMQSKITVQYQALLKGKDLNNDYYFIDLNNCHSMKTKDGKSIVLVGFSNEDIQRMINGFGNIEKHRQHKSIGLYILDKK